MLTGEKVGDKAHAQVVTGWEACQKTVRRAESTLRPDYLETPPNPVHFSAIA